MIKKLKKYFQCPVTCPHYLFPHSYHGECIKWIHLGRKSDHVCQEGHIW